MLIITHIKYSEDVLRLLSLSRVNRLLRIYKLVYMCGMVCMADVRDTLFLCPYSHCCSGTWRIKLEDLWVLSSESVRALYEM